MDVEDETCVADRMQVDREECVLPALRQIAEIITKAASQTDVPRRRLRREPCAPEMLVKLGALQDLRLATADPSHRHVFAAAANKVRKDIGYAARSFLEGVQNLVKARFEIQVSPTLHGERAREEYRTGFDDDRYGGGRGSSKAVLRV
ncbi:unnamed protein product [Prorocentrum cordatum]|uniref:Uncharacterized protein n=1 Tax=Prorocentrum cordatum TaxID=2364126 RepID=A0ABN9RTH9_9DINO|nr:unnamed protein product [Polarella glacialis]